MPGANDKVKLSLIGLGGCGQDVLGTFKRSSQVSVNAACGILGDRRDETATRAPSAGTLNEHRRLLAMKEMSGAPRSRRS